jgi:hypothetical protein
MLWKGGSTAGHEKRRLPCSMLGSRDGGDDGCHDKSDEDNYYAYSKLSERIFLK